MKIFSAAGESAPWPESFVYNIYMFRELVLRNFRISLVSNRNRSYKDQPPNPFVVIDDRASEQYNSIFSNRSTNVIETASIIFQVDYIAVTRVIVLGQIAICWGQLVRDVRVVLYSSRLASTTWSVYTRPDFSSNEMWNTLMGKHTKYESQHSLSPPISQLSIDKRYYFLFR